jgi:Tol biopolymer transport system component
MTLAPGTRLGPYEIVDPLGSGGMGEVYRARDTRLGRDVAVKVLPQHLSSNPDIRARFEREAKSVSALNHPHICTLHDVGKEGDIDYLVMELVDGETLAERLAKGPLPLEQALAIGRQVADALDRAHRAGIVHRDLKPGNVMLTRSGAKLMDFGLARATGLLGPGGTSGVTVAALTTSPTVASPLTVEGTIVGTYQYMSPEQLEGKEADTRSDIWALGCVLFEMVTGKRAFDGRSQALLISSIMTATPPPLAQAAPLAPPALDRIISACLHKDPEQRIQTAHDVGLQLQWVAEGGSQAGVPAPVAARRKTRERLAWGLAALGVLATAALGILALTRRDAPPRVVRFHVTPPGGTLSMSWPRLSPDGTMLAFVAADSNGVRQVWVRRLDALEAQPLAAVAGGARPFWSPDSKNLGFFTEGKLRRVAIAGGPAVTIADIQTGFDGTWGAKDVILYDFGATDSLHAVSASGGLPRPATTFDRAAKETQHAWPYFLPDGEHFLFLARQTNTGPATIRLGKLGSLESVAIGATDGRVEYAPPGYLVYPSGGTLLAQPFDVKAGKTTGDPVPVGEDIVMSGASGDFSLSNTGVMAYLTGSSSQDAEIVWYDRRGRRLGPAAPPGGYTDVALSPDDNRIALTVISGQPIQSDIFIRDLERGTTSRLTFDPADEIWPVWSPDGHRVAFTTARFGEFRSMVKAASGVGTEDSLQKVPGNEGPTDWSRDGRTLVTAAIGPQNWDVLAQPLDRSAPHRTVIQTPFAERDGALSPNGRWLAYSSNESGRREVYVVPFPGPGGKWQVSPNGGDFPAWSADGTELFYRTVDQILTVVSVSGTENLVLGTPEPLFRANTLPYGRGGRRWDVTADGQRFLICMPVGAATLSRLTVVTEWTSELQKK